MEQITLYHRGTPVTRHPLFKGSFSIGSHPSNDLVLVGAGVAERQLVISRGEDGLWRARRASDDHGLSGSDLASGTRIAMGPFALEFDELEWREQIGQSTVAGPAPDRTTVCDDLGLAGVSPKIRLVKMEMRRFGPLRAPVLITGETGSGKELVARGIHRCSKRSDGPFIAVNCGALTGSLIEDTLFGHERGAFTGATSVHRGVFEQAQGGSLFLDEIGELPLAHQSALLRVLDDGKVKRIGRERDEAVDFRLIAATNRDIAEMVEKKRFRADLFHRVAALKVEISSLRDRPEDVEPLARCFLDQMAEELGERDLSPDAVEKLSAHDWAGNARELRNALYRAASLAGRRTIRSQDLDLVPTEKRRKRQPFRLDEVPDSSLEQLLEENDGNVTAAARKIGVPRTTLRDRLKKLGNPDVDQML